jgi:hypothetical protein
VGNISGKFINVAGFFYLVAMALGIKIAISGEHDRVQAMRDMVLKYMDV